jgi:Ca2+-binding RTX toxin-like protein
MSQRRFLFRPLLEALEDRLCPSSTTVLPISAFLAQQGTSTLLTSPVPDQIAWSNSAFDPGTTPSDPNRLIMVDYTGTAAQYLLQHGINLNTKITGLVTETPIVNSTLMEVSVSLEVSNALTWVAHVPAADLDTPAINTDPLELGYRAQDLVANPSLKPALSSAHLQLTFMEQTGAPLPDLFQALIIGNAPPGFTPERIEFQSWGTGTLDAGTTVGTPGQTAVATTSQVADFTSLPLPGTLPDGFWQEPVNIVPVASATSSVAYLNGTLFITDMGNGNDHVTVTPAAGGGATVSSNLGSGTFADVTAVVVSLGGGNNNVQIGTLPGANVNVNALDGNNNITIGNESEVVVSVGAGNNHINTGNTSVAQQIFVAGSGNNHISAGSGNNVVLVAGNGNNHISASGSGDFVEALGNGNNHITDSGSNDLVWLGGDGNNDIDNQGAGSFTDILAGTGHNHILGLWAFGDGA